MGKPEIPEIPWPGEPGDRASFEALMAEHVEWMRARSFSECTVVNRVRHVKTFALWCAERNVLRPVEVTLPMLERYQRALLHRPTRSAKPLSVRSQHYCLTDLRLFFRWLARGHHLPANPASELDLPKLPLRLPRSVLSVEEAEKVIGQPDVRDPMGLRDRAIMEVFYSTGMRRAELVGLKVYDIDWTRGTVMIRHGKGGKDRVVPIGERAMAWLWKYLEEARPTLAMEPDDGTVFLTVESTPFHRDHMSRLMRDYVTSSGVEKEGACHLFRHSAATSMLENGADIRFIQEMLGHACLETTQIYTRVSIKKLKEIHTATHPAAKMERRRPEGASDSEDEATKEELLSSLAAEEAAEPEEP